MHFPNLVRQLGETLSLKPKNKSICYIRQLFQSSNLLVERKDKLSESPLKKMLDESASFQDIKSNDPQQQWATLPYPQGTNVRKQGEFYTKPSKIDPKDTSIILFPGQGSQYVGMAKELLKFPKTKDLFDLASHILGYDLLDICLNGPQSKLDQTKYAQPAIVVSSLAAIEKLREERPNAIENCVGTAGFSLGEITALIFAGSIPFERGMQLVKIRAEAMQLATETYKGAMLRVVFGPDSNLNLAMVKAKEWAKDNGDPLPECSVSNYLFPHCKVVAGSISAIQYLEKNFKEFKLRNVKRMPLSGAFHSQLVASAVEPFSKALAKSDVQDPVVRVYSNVDGKPYRDAAHIKKQLPMQLLRPVKWEQLLHVVYEREPGLDFPRTFSCGPSTALKKLLQEVNAKAADTCWTIEA